MFLHEFAKWEGGWRLFRGRDLRGDWARWARVYADTSGALHVVELDAIRRRGARKGKSS